MTPKLLTTSALLACALLVITAVDAAARGWGYRGGHGGAFGHYYARSFHAPGWSHSASINRAPGRVTGTRSFQTPGGRGATRNFTRGCSGATCDRSFTTTTNSGKTWSHSNTRTRSGTGTVSRTRTTTGPNGGTTTRTSSCTSGVGCNSQRVTSGPRGQTRVADRTTTPNGDGTFHHTATITGPGGTKTRSFDVP